MSIVTNGKYDKNIISIDFYLIFIGKNLHDEMKSF